MASGYYGDLSSLDNVDEALETARGLLDSTAALKTQVEVIQTDVTNKVSTIKTYQDNATAAAAQAASSATAAATSATAAGSSQSAANTSATSASASASSASQSASDATAAKNTATTAATNAANSASSASTSATNAGNSASSAQTNANTASTAATNAGNSATAAGTSATNAKTSETNSKTSETNSKTSETNAASSATSASNSATSASNSANTASNAANQATTVLASAVKKNEKNTNTNGTYLSAPNTPGIVNLASGYASPDIVPLTVSNQGDNTAAAVMQFNREGTYRLYMGLDTDNVLKLGGGNLGAVASTIWHEAMAVARVKSTMASMGSAEIGAYGFLKNSTGNPHEPGQVYSGSLFWSSTSNQQGGSLGGSWRCMGQVPNTYVGLYLRVA